MNDSFPDNCLKGIPNQDFVYEDGIVKAHLFEFNENHSHRGDDWIEQSINWHDEEDAIKLTLQQRKVDGTLQFKYGVAVLPRTDVDYINSSNSVRNRLSYERAPLDENPYHGNLLIHQDIPKPMRKSIAASISLRVSNVIKRQE